MIFSTSLLKIRKMELKDADEVVNLTKKVWIIDYKGIVDEAVLSNFPINKFSEGRKSILNKPQCNSIVAIDNEYKILGFSDSGPARDSDKAGEIYALYVNSSHQNQGIGNSLFQAQFRKLKDEGYKNLIVWTFEMNKKSRRFYEKMNGTLTAREDKEFFAKKYPSVKYEWQIT